MDETRSTRHSRQRGRKSGCKPCPLIAGCYLEATMNIPSSAGLQAWALIMRRFCVTTRIPCLMEFSERAPTIYQRLEAKGDLIQVMTRQG
jgi:hypothetical protein